MYDFNPILKKQLSPTEEERLDVLDNIEFSYKKTTRNPSFAELIDTFPEAVPAARRTAKGVIKELKKAISGLSDFREVCNKHVRESHFKRQPELISYYDELISKLLQKYEQEIKKYNYQLAYLDGLNRPCEPHPQGDPITPERIERATQYPISDLLEIRRGTVRCIFHDDTRPSLKYYPKGNRVYCFSCARGEDAIGVFMQINRCDFRTAVRALAV